MTTKEGMATIANVRKAIKAGIISHKDGVKLIADYFGVKEYIAERVL